ncbi:MAG TPA: luciferase family protein [Rubrobacter sp.]|jgi:hypothetical protein
MNDEPLAQIERELLRWDGVFKKRDEDGPGGIGVTSYRYGDPETGGPQIGHVHDDGHADFRFPREVRDELIRTGRAIPHPAFPNSRTTATYSAAMVIWGTLLQRRVPEGLRGRVSSLDFFVSLVLMPVSMAIAGPAGAAFGLTAVSGSCLGFSPSRPSWSPGSTATSSPTRSTTRPPTRPSR